MPTLLIDSRWLLLDSEGLDALMGDGPRGAGWLTVDPNKLDQLSQTVPGARGRTTCASGTSTYLVAGERRSQVTGAIPVSGG